MSKIEKMTIMGIRSFGPDDSDRQKIEFFSPLTLIVGPNGSGKTTIIECLKYITTGDMPPNSKGGAFVHDPKVAHELIVRGQVRLALRDVRGKILQVQRSLEASQKVKRIETKTLDAVITRLDPAGEKRSITTKCTDYEREMVTALGVSKSVLDNVIFCHQEDSCWPLSEGKALKDKFDAIFASTRYTKVLENIRRLKLEQDGSIKLFKQDIQYLKQHKDKATELEGDLAELEAKFEASKGSVTKIEQQLQPVRDQLRDIGQRYEEVHKVNTKIEKLKSQKGQMETTLKDLHDNIENEFQGTTAELEKLLYEFKDKVQSYEDNLRQFEQTSKQNTARLEILGREKSKILLEVGRLQQEAETHEDNIRRRDAAIRKLAMQYEFKGFDHGAITDEKYQTFLENINHKVKAMDEEVLKVKREFEEQETAIQRKIDAARDMKTQFEQTERYKKEQMDKNKVEIRQIKQKLSHMESSAGRLDQLKQELRNAEHELSLAENAINLEDLKREISQLDRERRQLETQMNELNSEMNRLHLQSSTRTQLDMLKKDKASKEDNIRKIKAKHEDSLEHLLGNVIISNVRGQLDKYISCQSESTRKCSAEMQKAKTQLSQKEAEKNLLSKQIRGKEEEARRLEERISNVCGSQNFEESFEAVQQKLAETQDHRGSLLGAEHFFKKYARDLEKDEPCCPLCHREFDSEQEVRELVLELDNKLRLVPSKLHKAEEELVQHQNKYDSMTQLKPIKENLSIIQKEELPSLRRNLQKISEEIVKLKEEIEEKSVELSMKEADEEMAKSLHPDIVLMDRYQGEVRELEKKIAVQAGKLAGGDTSRTLEFVINEKDETQIKLNTISNTLDHKRQKQTDHTEHLQVLQSQVNSLQAEKLEIDAELQQRTTLEEKQAQLLSDTIECEADIKAAKEQLRPLEDEISHRLGEKEAVVKTKEAAVDQGKAAIDEIRSKSSSIKEINKSIDHYNRSGKLDQLRKSQARQQETGKEQNKLEMEQEEVAASMHKMREILVTQQIRERELSDNLKLREETKNIERLEREIAEYERQLGGLDPKNLEQKRQELLQKDNELNKELHRASGRQQGYEDEIRSKKKELNSDMYCDASKRHREKMIELRTTELANTDLEKYYKAMDRAIMNYHSQKMTEINMIIRELWRNTYRGHDIDTIEIRSDDDDSTAMKSRRVYNYRVVMLKGETALDMRGRCSAGQKVLASLIIRLALAETFCMNCSVIALDEPTTNLDQENIDSLAHALVRIIEARRQRNFQLIVITHDEGFVEKLGRSELTEYVWKVYKNPNGNSCLKKDTIQQFQQR